MGRDLGAAERDSEEVFEAARALLASPRAKERGRGVDILAQWPNPEGRMNEARRGRCADEILRLLTTESEPAVLASIGVALGHLHEPRAPAALVRYRQHPDPAVRLGVVHAMTMHADPLAIATMIEASRDPDEEVRNWATFGLGSMQEGVDSAELRDALVARLIDDVLEISGEALVGLAHRRDVRVLEPLRSALSNRPCSILAVEAAQLLGDPSLLPLLEHVRDGSGESDDHFKHVLAGAIAELKREP